MSYIHVEPMNCNLHPYQLLLSGDCHPHPGPTYKFPCGICAKPYKSNQHAVARDSCNTWYHVKCTQMPLPVYHRLTQNTSWICFTCGVLLHNHIWNTVIWLHLQIHSHQQHQQHLIRWLFQPGHLTQLLISQLDWIATTHFFTNQRKKAATPGHLQPSFASS